MILLHRINIYCKSAKYTFVITFVTLPMFTDQLLLCTLRTARARTVQKSLVLAIFWKFSSQTSKKMHMTSNHCPNQLILVTHWLNSLFIVTQFEKKARDYKSAFFSLRDFVTLRSIQKSVSWERVNGSPPSFHSCLSNRWSLKPCLIFLIMGFEAELLPVN